MNKLLKALTATFALTFTLGLSVACGGGNGDGSSESTPPTQSVEGDSSSVELKEITGVTFDSQEYPYNGEERELKISGELPDGVSATYSGNKGTDADTYQASVTLSGDGYKTKTLTATLTITKIAITTEIEFKNDTVEYDTNKHTLQIVGDIPAGTNVIYKYNGQEVDGVSEVGEYTVLAIISGKNYITKELSAKLTIKSTEKLLYSANFNGTIYFQNDLDDQKLYKIVDGEVEKVNNDVPEYFFSDGTSLYYYSASLWGKTIKKIAGDGSVSQVYSVSGEYLTSDGTNVYYAVNNLLFNTDQNGIYSYPLNGGAEEATRLTTDKAAYLCVVDGYIYYSNLSQNKYLYKIPVSGGAATCLHEEKVEYIIADQDTGMLYFDSTKTASAIYKYNTSTGLATKMTTDSGKYLTKVGNDIYYVNNDLLTSTLFGDGIYKISVTASGSLPGTKVLSTENNGYSSLTSDGELLYYYKLNDKHLYSYDASTGEETDMMENYTPPVEQVVYVGGAAITEYNGEVYYTNPLDSSCLYKYNPQTGARVKVLSDSVANVWFHDGYMYYSTFVLTNYALFKMDLQTHTSVKVTSDRAQDLIFEGDDIYFLDVNASPAKNTIKKMAKDGTVTEIFTDENVHISGLEKIGDTFYFVRNPGLGFKTLYSYTIGNTKAVNLGEKAFEMVIVGDKIYYYDDTENALQVCDLDGDNAKTLVSNVTINDLCVKGNVIYYSTTDKTKGLYSYSIISGENAKISDKLADGMAIINGQLWFINTCVEYTEVLGISDAPVHSSTISGENLIYDGDGRLYCYDGTNVVLK